MSSDIVIQLPFITDHVIYAGLFSQVTNAAFLRQQLLDGNSDFEYALIDASTVLSTKQVLGAVFRAINDQRQHRLRSRNVHSEIVFALSPTNNISDSFRKFGVGDVTTTLIAIKVIPASGTKEEQSQRAQAVRDHLEEVVKGQAMPFTDENLQESVDLGKVRKLYKLPAPDLSNGAKQPNVLSLKSEQCGKLEGLILGMMAIKGS